MGAYKSDERSPLKEETMTTYGAEQLRHRSMPAEKMIYPDERSAPPKIKDLQMLIIAKREVHYC
jgi:hypothetical protein